MKKYFISIITSILATICLAGCQTQKSTTQTNQQNMNVVSKTTMIQDYNQIIDKYATVIGSYADSLRDNQIETQKPTQQANQTIDRINTKLQKSTLNKNISNNFIKMNNALKEVIACYANNNFTDLKKKQAAFNQDDLQLRKDLNINTSNQKLTAALNKLKAVADSHATN
ncbi:hypothetical protein [Bombilactobacillus thymidiniphilus]|uniref:Lipoprotein n=1 Tax=Bombilactobacillus thymidiniphilus TaxID=2923363 RepID=A0ABY4PB96_9LACO|nr:hypothetical protein [Bombilactobacillus thymidiniphilus]UQS83030.1 hypothetical protein MOO47_04400 [Bombilactobacillus thymidiniphilus]